MNNKSRAEHIQYSERGDTYEGAEDSSLRSGGRTESTVRGYRRVRKGRALREAWKILSAEGNHKGGQSAHV